jgi:hypothetical protein
MSSKTTYAIGANPFDTLFEELDKQLASDDGSIVFSDDAVECFYDFLKEGRFVVDGAFIDPDKFPWLMPFYKIRRADILANKYSAGFSLFKPAQVGYTVAMMLFLCWLCIGEKGLQIGFFFHNKSKLEDLIQTRFNKIVEMPQIQQYIKPKAVNNTRAKQIHNSIIRFLYTEGEGGVDSVPLQVLIFDEVRLMDHSAVEGAKYRAARQSIRAFFYGSTAGTPTDPMAKVFNKSDQQRWHSQCEGCQCKTSVTTAGVPDSRYGKDAADFDAPAGLPLTNIDIPQFIRPIPLERHTDPKITHEYFCYHTGQTIDPLNGGFVAHNPGSAILGFHFGACLSPLTPATEIQYKFENDVDRKEFWNATMALANVGASGALVNSAHTTAARELGAALELEWGDASQHGSLFAGIDCRTEELHVVIGSKEAVVHVEVIQGEQGFQKLEELMARFGVSFYILDYKPQTTLTLPYARRNPRAALANYSQGATVRWRKEQSDWDISEDVRETKIVLIDRTKGIKHAMSEFTLGKVAVPLMPLYQNNFVDRHRKAHIEYDVAEEFLDGLRNLVVVQKPKEQKLQSSKQKVIVAGETEETIANLNYDPHFAHAFTYYRMAILLQSEGATVLPIGKRDKRPDGSPRSPRSPRGKQAELSSGGTCGTCAHFVESLGYCKARDITGIVAHRPKCDIPQLYQPK